MNLRERFGRYLDARERAFAMASLAYVLATGLALGLLPLSYGQGIALSTVMTVAMMAVALYTLWKAVKLYGPTSTEGKLWVRFIAMMLVTAVGLVIGQIVGDVRIFAGFALVGFGIVAYGMYSRLRDCGVRPRKRYLLVSTLVTILLLVGVTGVVVHLGGLEAVEDDPSSFYLQGFVVAFALCTTFLSVLLSMMMGGHISRGWHFLAAGSIIFSLTYSLVQVLKATGGYERMMFIEAFQVLALACLAFSAYYQRKRHLELIA